MSTEQKVALVTGASRGIGNAILSVLGAKGVAVYGTATNEAGAQKITDQIKASGLQGKGLVLNISEAESIEALLATFKAENISPDVLVNNAGITRDNLLMRMSETEWHEVINTNLTGVFRLTKALIRPMMKARFGRIINIGSVVGATGNPGQANYCAAKAGLEGFSRALAKEVATRGITVNIVSPGFIATDMTKDLPEDWQTYLKQMIPMQEQGKPEDIAHAVAYLASSEASYVTGQTLHVNGGMYM